MNILLNVIVDGVLIQVNPKSPITISVRLSSAIHNRIRIIVQSNIDAGEA